MADIPQPLARPTSVECSICIQSVAQLQRLECNHMLCGSCLNQKAARNSNQQKISCPSCRQESPDRRGISVAFFGDIRCFDCLQLEHSDRILWCAECVKLICMMCDHPAQKGHSVLGHSVDRWHQLTALKKCTAVLGTLDIVEILLRRLDNRAEKHVDFESVRGLLCDTYRLKKTTNDLVPVEQKHWSSYVRVANTALQLAGVHDITLVAPEIPEGFLDSSVKKSLLTALCGQTKDQKSGSSEEDAEFERLNPQQKETILEPLPMVDLGDGQIQDSSTLLEDNNCTAFYLAGQPLVATSQELIFLSKGENRKHKLPDAEAQKVKVWDLTVSEYEFLVGLERVEHNRIELWLGDLFHIPQLRIFNSYPTNSALKSMNMPSYWQSLGLMYISLSYESSGCVLAVHPATRKFVQLKHEKMQGRMGPIQIFNNDCFLVYNQDEGKIFVCKQSFFDSDPVLLSEIDLSDYPNLYSMNSNGHTVRGKGDGYIFSTNMDGSKMRLAKVPSLLQKSRMNWNFLYARIYQLFGGEFRTYDVDFEKLEKES